MQFLANLTHDISASKRKNHFGNLSPIAVVPPKIGRKIKVPKSKGKTSLEEYGIAIKTWNVLTSTPKPKHGKEGNIARKNSE